MSFEVGPALVALQDRKAITLSGQGRVHGDVMKSWSLWAELRRNHASILPVEKNCNKNIKNTTNKIYIQNKDVFRILSVNYIHSVTIFQKGQSPILNTM